MPVRAERPGHVWTEDFLKDRCENGQALRILTRDPIPPDGTMPEG